MYVARSLEGSRTCLPLLGGGKLKRQGGRRTGASVARCRLSKGGSISYRRGARGHICRSALSPSPTKNDGRRRFSGLGRVGCCRNGHSPSPRRCSMGARGLPSAPVWSGRGRILLYLLLLVSRLWNLVGRLGNHSRPRDTVCGIAREQHKCSQTAVER